MNGQISRLLALIRAERRALRSLFEACSDFTRVTASRIAHPPMAAFVTRLRPGVSPSQTARQLPDQSTTLRVEASSTGDTRLRAALLPAS